MLTTTCSDTAPIDSWALIVVFSAFNVTERAHKLLESRFLEGDLVGSCDDGRRVIDAIIVCGVDVGYSGVDVGDGHSHPRYCRSCCVGHDSAYVAGVCALRERRAHRFAQKQSEYRN